MELIEGFWLETSQKWRVIKNGMTPPAPKAVERNCCLLLERRKERDKKYLTVRGKGRSRLLWRESKKHEIVNSSMKIPL